MGHNGDVLLLWFHDNRHGDRNRRKLFDKVGFFNHSKLKAFRLERKVNVALIEGIIFTLVTLANIVTSVFLFISPPKQKPPMSYVGL